MHICGKSSKVSHSLLWLIQEINSELPLCHILASFTVLCSEVRALYKSN